MNGTIYEQIERAIEQIQTGEVEEGLGQLRGMLAYARQDPEVAFQLADIFYELGHLDTALTLLLELEPFFHDVSTDMQIEIRALRAEMLIDVGQLDQAMGELLQCLELEPDHIGVSVLLADLYLMQNLPEVACRYLERILETHEDEPDVAFILSELYVDLGEWEKALDLFEQLKGTEYEQRVAISKGNLFSQMGRFEEAYTLFQAVRAADPVSEEALLGCAVTALQLDQGQVAIELCDQLLALDEDHLGAYQVKGEALQKEDRLDAARTVFEQALSRNEHEDTIYLKLVELHFLMDDLEQAKNYLKHLFALDEQHEQGKEWQARLYDSRLN
ncbi:tetratricopeptide repeat protein [Ammoniphilus oxalaticus]|uniref:tetratricopeptide repeat protein n=1 Tax=Ammoniphilus oxalaticus TaxID=66863 RepID=UPI0011C3E641|nr:tetratricopeptide repeat protein [Ammoniphilus oxalaticus]